MTVTDTAEVLSDGSAVVEQPADAEANQLRVRGMLIPEGAISEGMSGKPTRWPGDVLEDAADREVFVGKPITIPPDWDPEQHVGVTRTDVGVEIESGVTFEDKVGEIESTRYESGEGLFFEGFIADSYAGDLVQRALAQISPVMFRSVEEVDADGTDYDELYEARQIGSVRDLGLVPDGGMPGNHIEAMSAFYAEALSARFDSDEPADTGIGSGSGDGPEGDDDPSAEGQTTSGADGSGDADADTTGQTMTDEDDYTEEELEVLRQLPRYEEPVLVERADAEALSRADELLAAADDVDGDVEVVAADDYEALQSHVETIDGQLGGVLTETFGLNEKAVEAMSFEAKVAALENDEGELSLEALSQTPETGGSGGEPNDDSPSEESLDEARALQRDIEALGSSAPETLKTRVTELTDAESYDEAVEVL
ncbi:hypothetical protein [Natronorarus salvus]|uniref:hypothetical protein n=1 Tax=Natronorarus salvus TaxID=3117733 RepID=UPI002F25F7FC